MNLLCCTIEDWVQWTTIIANILTLITIIPIIFALITYCKNRVCKKSFKLVDIRIGKPSQFHHRKDLKVYNVRFVFYNLTSSIFYITKCGVQSKDMSRSFVNKYMDGNDTHYETDWNICAMPNAPVVIAGYLIWESEIALPKNLSLIIQLANEKVFQYEIDTTSLIEIKNKKS